MGSRYAKYREALSGSVPGEKKTSRYARYRELSQVQPDITNDSGLLNQQNLEMKKLAAKKMVENASVNKIADKKPEQAVENQSRGKLLYYDFNGNPVYEKTEDFLPVKEKDSWVVKLGKGIVNAAAKGSEELSKFQDTAGTRLRQVMFGDTRPYENKLTTPTTGNKTVDTLADIAGTIGGFTMPAGGGAPSFAGPVRKLSEKIVANIGKTATTKSVKVAGKALTGAIESVPYSAQQIAVNKDLQNPKEMLKTVSENIFLGAGSELAILGLGKIGKSIIDKIKTKKPLLEAEIKAIETLPDDIKKDVYKQLPSAERLLLPEKATSSLEAPSVPLTQYEKKLLKTPAPTKKVEVPVETTVNKVSTLRSKNDILKAKEAGGVSKEITIPYRKNTEKAPKITTDDYAQSIEPKGDYVNYHDPEWGTNLPNYEYGNITFKKPLMVDYITTGHGGWKTNLSKKYGNKTGKALSDAVKKDGYDSIIAVDKEKKEVLEIVNLNGTKSNIGNPQKTINESDIITPNGVEKKIRTFEPSTEVQKGTVTKTVPNEKAVEKLKTLEEKQRQQIASMTGSKVLPEQPKLLQAPEQYKREMPRRTTTAEIESTKGTPQITKLRTPTKPVETPKVVENIQTTTPKTTALNGVQKFKTSKFRTNTLERAKNIPADIKKKLNPDDFDYIPETSKEWQEKAVQNVTENRQKVINNIKSTETISGGVQAHEASIIANDLVEQSKKTGNVDELLNFTQDVATKTREWARGLKGTDTAWDKLSPAGTLIKAQREIMNSVPDELKTAVKSEVKETKSVLEAINKVNKENIDQVFKDLIGEKPKASKAVRQWIETQEVEARNRIKSYYESTEKFDLGEFLKSEKGSIKLGKQPILRDFAIVGATKLARKTMDFAEWSVEMVKEFGEKIKPYLQQIFDESNTLIKSKSLRTPEQKTVSSIDSIVRKTLNENGIKIQYIARKHVSEIDETGQTLAQKLTEQANLSPEVAAKVEKLFAERLKALTTTKKQQILDQMFKPRKSYQRKSLGDKIIEFSNMGAIGDSKYTKILNEKYNIPELDAETAKKIIKQAENIQTVDNVFERQKLVNKMMNDIRNKIPSSFAAKAKSFTMINTLLNPKTIGSRNILGNITQMAAMRSNKAIMSAIDFTTSKLTGKDRTITFKTNRGIGNVIKDFFSDVKTGAKSGWEGYTPYGSVSEFKMASQSFQGKYNPLTYMEKALGAALSGAGDYPFYMKAVMDSIGEQSVLKAMNQGLKGQALKDASKKYADEIINSAKNISDFSSNVLKKANEAGEKATFRDSNIISNILQGVHDTFNIAGFGKTKATIGKIPSREFGLGDIVIMFARTPGALLNIGLEYSPAGALKSLYYIGEGIFKHAKGTGGVNREKVIESLTKAIGGTLLLSGTGYYLTAKGAVTGKAPKDKEARNFFDENGMKSYSFNVDAITRWFQNGFNESQLKPQKGDKWYTYDWLAPFSFNVGLGANVAQEGIGFKTLKTIPDIMGASVQMFAENDAISKLINVQVNKDITERLIDTAVAIPSRFVPMGSILNQIRQMTDNTKRDVASDDWKVKTINLLKNRLPGLSKTLPEVINQDGTVKEMYAGGSNNPLNVFLSPGYLGIYETSPGRQLLIDLYKSTGKTSQFPKTATNKLTVYQQDITLTAEEKAKLQKYVGRITWQTLDELPEQKEFAELSDEKKLRVISNLLEEIGNIGEEYIGELKGIKPETKSEKKKRLKESKVPKLKVAK